MYLNYDKKLFTAIITIVKATTNFHFELSSPDVLKLQEQTGEISKAATTTSATPFERTMTTIINTKTTSSSLGAL